MRILILLLGIFFASTELQGGATLEKLYANYTVVEIDRAAGKVTLSNGTKWQQLRTNFHWDEMELRGSISHWRVGDRVHLRPRENGRIRLVMENLRTTNFCGIKLIDLPPEKKTNRLLRLSNYEKGSFWSDTDRLELDDGTIWELPGDLHTRRNHARKWQRGDVIMTEVVSYWMDGPKEKLIFFNLSRDPSRDYLYIPVQEERSSMWPQFMQ